MSSAVDLGPAELELAQEISREVWAKYDDQFGYRTEKLEKNDSVSTNIPDNIWFFWGQFDSDNHAEFYTRLLAGHDKDPGYKKLHDWVLKEYKREAELIASLSERGIEL